MNRVMRFAVVLSFIEIILLFAAILTGRWLLAAIVGSVIAATIIIGGAA